MNIIKKLTQLNYEFQKDEWLLEQKIKTLLVMSFVLIAVLILFMFIRFFTGEIVTGTAIIFGIIIFYTLIKIVKKDKKYYNLVASAFIFIATLLITIGIFASGHDPIRGVWLTAVVVIAYYFKDKKEGLKWMTVHIMILLMSMYLNPDPYIPGYFIIIFSIVFIASLLYFYDKIKEKEQQIIIEQRNILELAVEERTQELHDLNTSLEQKVTEQTKALQESKESLSSQYNLLQNILNTVPVRIFWKDRESRFLGCNNLFVQDSGLPDEKDLIGKSDYDMVWKNEADMYVKDDKAVMESGITKLNIEEPQTHKDGSTIWLSTSKVPLRNDDGEIYGLLGAYIDITEKKEQELALKNKDIQLQQQSRLAQMGEMISMIAHQWRQPLGAISATAVNLTIKLKFEMYDLNTSEGQKECQHYFLKELNNIENLVQNLTSTIDDFRNFYKPNKESSILTLEEVTTKALGIIKISLESNGVKIVCDYQSQEQLEMYDREIMQVILNILKNSQDNFREKQTKDPKITITTQEKSIVICDNGGGIPQDVIEKIFDPYFSTKSEKNGTGLGLYMSKTIVEDHHNGYLHVNNSDDGVCFRIEFLELTD